MLPQSLPASFQPGQGQTHARPRNGQMMYLLQVSCQQRSGPDGRAIAQLARIAIDHGSNQRINNPLHCAGTTTTLAGRNASHDGEGATSLEVGDPFVDSLPADPQAVGHLLGTLSLVEPQQGLDSAQGPGIMKMGDEVFQGPSLPVAKNKGRHQFTLAILLLVTQWAEVAVTHQFVNRLFRIFRSFQSPFQPPKVASQEDRSADLRSLTLYCQLFC